MKLKFHFCMIKIVSLAFIYYCNIIIAIRIFIVLDATFSFYFILFNTIYLFNCYSVYTTMIKGAAEEVVIVS